MKGPFTGKHMLAVLVGGFGLVIAVNFTMASYAMSTFGGVVVKNSYVASQEFNSWLDKAEEARKLGWKVEASRAADGSVTVLTEGVPQDARITAMARHPLGRQPDRAMEFRVAGPDRYVSAAPLPDGRWTVRMEVAANGDVWRGEQALR